MDLDFGVNLALVEEMRARYHENPSSVAPAWRDFFEAQRRANDGEPGEGARVWIDDGLTLAGAHAQGRVVQLIGEYRTRGHLFAHLDPLDLSPIDRSPLSLERFGLSEADLDRTFARADLPGPAAATLRDILAFLEETYCRTIGAEFTQIEARDMRLWLQRRMEETRNRPPVPPERQLRILEKLTQAETFERFIQKNFPGAKRFSLEGAVSLVPLLDELIESAADLDAAEIVLGMAHRGRLSVLVNVCARDPREILAGFDDSHPELYFGRGDVKYHLGFSSELRTTRGRKIAVSLSLNPSHLEWVNPVVEGRTRGKQDRLGDVKRTRGIPVEIHGDAAVMGQGVVPETLNMASLEGYTTGGTIHVIVNNQIGFTTDPRDSRSTRYASDIMRMLKIPVFHVNGDDPEAVTHVARLAVEYRQRFAQSVVIDMYCYRTHGHNEADNPRFTQPRMYAAIDAKPSVRHAYVETLRAEASAAASQADTLLGEWDDRWEQALAESRDRGLALEPRRELRGAWKHFRGGSDADVPEVPTGVPVERLRELLLAMARLPDGFRPAVRQVEELIEQRRRAAIGEGAIGWGIAEHLAFATLLAQGTSVRLSGQDSRRGTFSHRHAVLLDRETEQPFVPLQTVAGGGARFDVFDSPLSEAAVLGFEYGYSRERPDSLVLWEAQFGDFSNAAQVVIDQFLASSEDKWRRLSGLVLLLPHGFEGQGPEHSSARLERWLSLCAEDNMQVCNFTTAAQLFHALRRQVIRPWRKPLVVMSPKSLLRDPRVACTLDDLANGSYRRVLADPRGPEPDRARRILLCTGKVFYDLDAGRAERAVDDVAIIRLEQLYPLDATLAAALGRYPRGTPITWVQEEPWNMGGWHFVHARLPTLLGGAVIDCVARPESASPATGSHAAHLLEQKMLVDEAFSR